jgi:hypothetical protein
MGRHRQTYESLDLLACKDGNRRDVREGGSTASAGSVCSRRRWREAHAISLAFHRKLENGYMGMGRGVSFEIEDIVAEVRGMVARCRQCVDVLCILWWQLKEVTGRSEIVQ